MSKSCDNNYQRACTKWARQWKRPSFNISEVHAPSYYDFIVYNLTRVFVNRMFKHFSATLSKVRPWSQQKFFGPSGLSLVYKQGGPGAQGPSPGSAITFCYKVFLLIQNVPDKWISLDPLLREDRMLLRKMPL